MLSNLLIDENGQATLVKIKAQMTGESYDFKIVQYLNNDPTQSVIRTKSKKLTII